MIIICFIGVLIHQLVIFGGHIFIDFVHFFSRMIQKDALTNVTFNPKCDFRLRQGFWFRKQNSWTCSLLTIKREKKKTVGLEMISTTDANMILPVNSQPCLYWFSLPIIRSWRWCDACLKIVSQQGLICVSKFTYTSQWGIYQTFVSYHALN